MVNGHFGFHVLVAGQRDISVDDYHIIRYQLLKELTGDDIKRYLIYIGLEKRFNEVKHSLTGDGIDPAPPDKWMIISDMDFLVAQRYKHMVVLMSINKR